MRSVFSSKVKCCYVDSTDISLSQLAWSVEIHLSPITHPGQDGTFKVWEALPVIFIGSNVKCFGQQLTIKISNDPKGKPPI